MDFSFTNIASGGMTIWGDILIILTILSAVLILLGGLIARLTQGKPPRWAWQWEAFAIGFIASTIGYSVKLFTDDLPIGAIFQFSRLTAGLLLLASASCVIAAVALVRAKQTQSSQD